MGGGCSTVLASNTALSVGIMRSEYCPGYRYAHPGYLLPPLPLWSKSDGRPQPRELLRSARNGHQRKPDNPTGLDPERPAAVFKLTTRTAWTRLVPANFLVAITKAI